MISVQNDESLWSANLEQSAMWPANT